MPGDTPPSEPAQPAGADQPQGADYLRLVGLGALVGIPAGFAAALFLAFIHFLEDWLWTDLPDALGGNEPQWYLLLALPVAGAAIVAIARIYLPGDGGHSPLQGLSADPTPVSHGPGVVLAAIGTLGFGAVLGPEMPVIAIGSVVALAATWFARLKEKESRVLATAGSFSAISALFGGPIVAGVMLVESGAGSLGAALLPALLPGFVAAAVGYVIFLGLGSWGGLDSPGLTVPHLQLYEGTHVLDLVAAVAIGVVAAVAILAVRRGATRVAERGESRFTLVAFLLAGGLAVGLIALAARGLGADSQEILFSGQASIPAEIAETSTATLLLVLLAKALAYAVSLSCGFRGGPIFPAIFLGIGIATLPVVWFDMSPTLAISVGAAAGMAAQTRLLLTAMLFGLLLVGTQGFDTVSAVVLAAAAAWITATALAQRDEATPSAA